ncbi:MAG: DUF4176 domain-containing protein [Firmicutes bacterium]|nr:DUF4176 domain-containing protein [Bacillota bacterium]
MEIKELLPIGTVVLLEGGVKKLMIFGVKQTDTLEDGTSTDYDYIGVLYPEGNMGKEYQFLFNHKDIADVVFNGFEDQERDNFIAGLEQYYQEVKNAESGENAAQTDEQS